MSYEPLRVIKGVFVKIKNDKYYTPSDLVDYVISKTFDIVGKSNITEIIEPSAGNGAFSSKLDCIAYDLYPESNNIIEQDYLELETAYKKGRLVIGNPPFGNRGHLMQKFCNKSFEIADYVSFILPANQLNNVASIYKFDLIYSEDLGVKEYSGKKVHCCLNIYQRPSSGLLNTKPNYTTNIIEIREVRGIIRNKNSKRNRELELGTFKHDFSICAWGKGAIGKECKEGQYAKTFYFKINDIMHFDYYKNLILSADWCNLYKMTGTPNLLQWQVINT